MKILFPIGSFYPAQEGGPNNSVYWLNKELNKHGIDTTVVSTMRGIKDADIAPAVKIDKYGVSSYFFNSYGKFFICPGLYRWVFKNIKDYDLIHLTSIFFPMSAIIAWIAYFKKVPFVISPRGELDEGAICYGKSKKIIYIRMVKSIFRKAAYFHATCENESNQIKKYFGKDVKCSIAPNAISSFSEPFEEIDIHEKFGMSKDDKFILSLGRISPKKALENLIISLTNVKHNNIVLLIAGNADNPYGEKLKILVEKLNISDRVKFIGSVEGDIKENLYSKAELFILASHTENFGNVVIEALNRRLPVIASKGTPWKILEQYNCGYWVDNDPKNLSNAINRYLGGTEIDKYRQNAERLIKERFVMSSVIGNYIGLYREVLECRTC